MSTLSKLDEHNTDFGNWDREPRSPGSGDFDYGFVDQNGTVVGVNHDYNPGFNGDGIGDLMDDEMVTEKPPEGIKKSKGLATGPAVAYVRSLSEW